MLAHNLACTFSGENQSIISLRKWQNITKIWSNSNASKALWEKNSRFPEHTRPSCRKPETSIFRICWKIGGSYRRFWHFFSPEAKTSVLSCRPRRSRHEIQRNLSIAITAWALYSCTHDKKPFVHEIAEATSSQNHQEHWHSSEDGPH